MNTFHIDPNSPLAEEAAILVARLITEYGNEVWIAIRGQRGYSYTDDEGQDAVEM